MMAQRRSLAAFVLALAVLASACSSAAGVQDGSVDGATAAEDDAGRDEEAASETTTEVVTPEPARGLSDDEQASLDAAIEMFLDNRSVTAARDVVTFMELSGEIRFAPWLVDLVQMGLSNRLNKEIIAVLAGLTGIEPSGVTFAEFGAFGSLVQNQAIDPGPDYRNWKLGLYDRLDPDFAMLLDSIEDDTVLVNIRYGGVPRGGIPELNDPARITAAEAEEWITADEVVIGAELDGDVVAYPFRIVGHHELVNDHLGDTPVSLVYCTLCRTGLLFDRRVAGQVLDFQTSGLLINSNKVMVDRQTDTLWHHAAGSGLGGELADVRLDLFPIETTTWAEWVARHPDTEVIDIPDPIFFDDPERPPIAYEYSAEGPYDNYYTDPDVWFPIFETPDSFEEKTEVIGIELGGGELALRVEDLVAGSSRFFSIGSGGVVVVPTSRGARVYDASETALVGADGPEDASSVDVVGETTDAATLADGTTLPRFAAEQGFWFSWFSLHPQTLIWPN